MATINETPYLTTNDRSERTINEVPYLVTGGGGGGTSDYPQLTNKPKVNGVELNGNKTTADLFSAGEGISFEDDTIGVDFNVASTVTYVNEKVGNLTKTVEITDVPATATQGTLTEEQLAALLESEKSVIKFNNEIYFLNDNGHEAGIRGYSHSGVENSKFMLKNITVTLSTGGWVLTSEEVGGGGGIKTLTTADYNYPANNPTSVALWLLPIGLYKIPTDLPYYRNSASLRTPSHDLLCAIQPYSSNIKSIFLYNDEIPSVYRTLANGGRITTDYGVSSESLEYVLTGQSVINNLASSSIGNPLSANQGKILNDRLVTVEGQLTGLEIALNTINNGGQA